MSFIRWRRFSSIPSLFIVFVIKSVLVHQSFYIKETVKRMKTQFIEWRKIFAKFSFGKRLISRTCKKVKSEKQTPINPVLKGKITESQFSKDVQMATNLKNWLLSLAIREMQIKATERCHLTLVNMAIMFLNANHDVEKKELLCTGGWKTIWRIL